MYKKLFIYTCSDCDKKRQTLKEDRYNIGVCRKCLLERNPIGMTSMFEVEEIAS